MQLLIVLVLVIVGMLGLAFSPIAVQLGKGGKLKIIVGGIVLLFLIVGGFSVSVIDASEVGVKVIFGKVSGDTVKEGINFISPFAKIVKYSIRLKEYTMSDDRGANNAPMNARTEDNTKVTIDMTVWFRINASDAYHIYKLISSDERMVAGIVQPVARSIVRDVVAKYKGFTELNKSRQTFASNTKFNMKKKLTDMGIEVVDVLVRKIKPPKEIEVAINKKLKRREEIKEKGYLLKIAEKNKEISVMDARGIYESQKIINRSLTAHYLQYMAIKAQEKMAQSKNHTTIYIPTGANGIPIVKTIR